MMRLAPSPAGITPAELLAGMGPSPSPFDAETEAFGRRLSEALLADAEARAFPDLAALGFWLRPAATQALRRHFATLESDGIRRVPRGLALHIAPANVETLFVYSWWLSALAGNANLVRVSGRAGARTALLLRLIGQILAEPAFVRLSQATAFLAFDHDPAIAAALSAAARLRVVWGGDATIAAFAGLPLAAGGVDITFPDRRSACTIAAPAYLALDGGGRAELVRRFFNDAYGFDQKACSSPLLLAWIGTAEEAEAAGTDFWARLAGEVENRSYAVAAATTLAQLTEAARLALDGGIGQVRRFGPGLLVVRGPARPPRPETCGGGLFEECIVATLAGIAGLMDAKLQTLTHFGLEAGEPARLAPLLAANGGGDRLVPVGTALDFSHVWDGHDLLAAMSRAIAVKER